MARARGPARRRAMAVALIAIATAASGCGQAEAPRPAPAAAPAAGTEVPQAESDVGPLGRLYRDPQGSAVQAARAMRPDTGPATRRATERIAAQPTAVWLTDPFADPYPEVDRVVSAAHEAGRLPTLVVYGIPERDCDGLASGGAASSDQYRAWVGSVAAGIRDRAALVILEPDAVSQEIDGCLRRTADQRQADLGVAIDILMGNPGTRVYLDAGNSSWTHPETLAKALIDSGISRASGFALNVANYRPTDETIQYGFDLGAMLPRKHFVIDVGRNGAEVNTSGDGWCNNPDARLGRPPTTATGYTKVDAFLWVKPPGNSDGECRGGPPPGTWWPDQAVRLES